MMRTTTMLACIGLLFQYLNAQEISGVIRGSVLDSETNMPISFATVKVMDATPPLGARTDSNGVFRFEHVPVGRYSLEVSRVGYSTTIINDVLVTSVNHQELRIKLLETSYSLDEVVLRPRQEKEKPINNMATLSAKQLNMDEANRFAGGFDDPARLVTSFAGVAGASVGNNSFSVRGNSPKGILWQIEGIPVPNPNHFGEITSFGGGGITALSTKTIGNSDFFLGAFPAEYGNALSSVFDLTIRPGNTDKRQHSFQLGFFGIDAASEGPIRKGAKASYLANYRYSTLGILGLGLNYQDLSFKLNFPTKKTGTFSFWGLGLIDASQSSPDPDTVNTEEPLDEEVKWQYYDDIATEDVQIATGVAGLTHKILLGQKSVLKTSVTASANQLLSENSRLDSSFTRDFPLNKIEYSAIDYRLSSTLNTKYNARHTNRTGVLLTNLNYAFDLKSAVNFGDNLTTFSEDEGSSHLIQAFSQSSIQAGRFRINPGLHFLYFALNDAYSLEPRLGMDFAVNDKIKLALGYGLHSQVEKLSFYLADIPGVDGTEQLNTNLDLAKSHHLVLGYDQMLGEHTHLRIEPYYQYLYDVPVIDQSHFSMLNLDEDFFINEALVNKGTGENYGIDITLERFQHQGFYYTTTLSLFESNYTDGSGIERPTRYNRKVVGNVLVGKEWLVKNKNLFSINLRYAYLGGNWTHPVNEAESLNAKEIVEDYSKAFSVQNPASHVMSFTLSYRVNSKKVSSLWSLQVLNTLGAKEYLGYRYNFRNHTIEENTDTIVLPNLSYRVEF